MTEIKSCSRPAASMRIASRPTVSVPRRLRAVGAGVGLLALVACGGGAAAPEAVPTVSESAAPSVRTLAWADGGFEQAVLPALGLVYGPRDSAWTPEGGAAVAAAGSGFFHNAEETAVAPPPEGRQVGVLQMNARWSRQVGLQPGDVLVFEATRRESFQPDSVQDPQQWLRVALDGQTLVGDATSALTLANTAWLERGAWRELRVPLTTVKTAGTYELTLQTEIAEPWPDRSIFIDRVRIEHTGP